MPENFTVRTDLANEVREILMKESGSEPDGILHEARTVNGIEIDSVEILNSAGEQKTGKPVGKYVTINIGKIWLSDYESFKSVCDVVADEIRKFLPESGNYLLAGLGNRQIIADAVGTETAANFIVTRHLKESSPELFRSFGFAETSSVTPGVLGNTGMESAEIVRGVVQNVKPSCLIVIDSLASRRLSRLATTVQISNTGISPGSGVENARSAINRETMGIPVIAIGVPTVVDAATLALDILEEAAEKEEYKNTLPTGDILKKVLAPSNLNYFVTPKETDVIIKDTAKLLGYSLNAAIHKDLSYDEMTDLL